MRRPSMIAMFAAFVTAGVCTAVNAAGPTGPALLTMKAAETIVTSVHVRRRPSVYVRRRHWQGWQGPDNRFSSAYYRSWVYGYYTQRVYAYPGCGCYPHYYARGWDHGPRAYYGWREGHGW